MDNGSKIGIVTLHSGYNEGAMLQTFCLATNMQKHLPNSEVEVVDHRYRSKVRAYGPVRDSKTRVLSDFVDYSLPLSKKRIVADDHRDTFDYIRENYGAVITGSDELWKLNYSSRFFGLLHEQNDPWCPAFPNVYWMDESVRMPKIAYAVSIGQTDWRTIPKKHVKHMKRILSGYSLLGVRDRRTMDFLGWLDRDIAERAEFVPDPAFSIDVGSLVDTESLKQRLQEWGVDFDRPRLCTVLRDSPALNDVISHQMKKLGYQVVSLSLPNSSADVDLSDKGFTPLEWFEVFGLMDFCISQRMHTCISCIVHETPFMAVDFYSNPMDDDTKIKDLMRSFHLLDYYYNAEKDTPEKFRTICKSILHTPWSVHEITQKRSLFNERSREFVQKIRAVVSTH